MPPRLFRPVLPPFPGWRRVGVLAAGLAVAVAAGWLLDRLDIPLAWVLGPLLAAAILSMSGVPVMSSDRVRRGGQMMIGIGLGLNITAALLAQVAWWIPAMALSALASMVVTATVSTVMARLGRLDRRTAYFALLPGGLVEMANIGSSVGARPEPIALAQAIRVALVVLILPPAIIALGISGDFVRIDAARVLPWAQLALVLAVAAVGVWVMTLLRTRNPYLMGPMFATGLMSGLGLVDGQMLPVLFYGGQCVLGVVIGARFKRDIIARLPVLSLLAAVFTVIITLILFAMGAALAAVSSLDVATAALATSAGGLIEMTLTAKILQLNIALVLGFHLVRAVIVNGFSVQVLHALERARLFDGMDRLMTALGARR